MEQRHAQNRKLQIAEQRVVEMQITSAHTMDESRRHAVDAEARLRQTELHAEHLAKQLQLAPNAQTAARDAHSAVDLALRQDMDNIIATEVMKVQNRALSNYEAALGAPQDQYTIQCSQAERKCNDARALVTSLQTQLDGQKERAD